MAKKKFTITVMRTAYAFHEIEVEANNVKDAEEKALNEAGDHEYSEKSADYSISNSIEK